MPDSVRPAKPGEGGRLGEIYLSSGRAAWARHLSPIGLGGVASSADEWERFITDPDLIVLVAERRGEPAALALLDRLYTEPASWRRGLGRALLDAAMDQLRERRFQEVTLWTAEWNTSRGFYEALGWQLDGATREKTFEGSTFTEVRYRTQVPR